MTAEPIIGKLYRVAPRASKALFLKVDTSHFLTLEVGICFMVTAARKNVRMCTDPRTKQTHSKTFWNINFLCLEQIYEDFEFPAVYWDRYFEQIGE